MSSINSSFSDNRINDSDELLFAPEIDEDEFNQQSDKLLFAPEIDETKFNQQNDELFFAPETHEVISIHEVSNSTKLNVNSYYKYKLLIVDDEPAIHDITRLLLNDFIFAGKKLEFISAFSSKEAEEAIQKHSDIALILLDVIMETDDAGLKFVKYVREVINNHLVRIVLRTGQPGMVPEDTIVEKYDIDDYKTKTELTKTRILTTVRTAIRVYSALNKMYQMNSKLEAEINYNRKIENELKFKSTQLENIIKELKNTQLQLIQNEKMSALGQLIAGVAHEINNPVCFINGNLQPMRDYLQDIFELIELYQEEYPKPSAKIQDEIDEIDLDYLREDIQKLIHSMEVGVMRIQNISKSLTIFSRGDLNDKINYDIHEGLESTILILQHRLKANQNRPEIEIIKEYGKIDPIKCFPGQLNQVFMNLLVNAIDALEDSNQGLSFQEIKAKNNLIQITTQVNNNHVMIKIVDNGNGMSPETLHRAFDYLFTTKPVGKGTGLGLSICRQIIEEKHNGKLRCHSEIGKGTTFIIQLPQENK